MRWVVVIACASCGRIGFDTLASDGTTSDGIVSAACEAQWLAGPTFGLPQPLADLNFPSAADVEPWLAPDDRTLYFTSGRTGNYDLYTSSRASVDGTFTAPQPVSEFNTTSDEFGLAFSRDGREAFLTSDRGGQPDIWRATRFTTSDSFGPLEVVPGISTDTGEEYNAKLSYDELHLYFSAYLRPGNLGPASLWVADRPARDQPFVEPRLLVELDSNGNEGSPTVIATGRVVVFASDRAGKGYLELWYATRTSADVPFDPPTPVPELNTVGEYQPFLRFDGCELFFSSVRAGGEDLYAATIVQ